MSMPRAREARRWLVLTCASVLAACVSARDTDGQGTSHFSAGLPAAPGDYAAGGTGGAGGMAPGGTGGIGGVGGVPLAGMGSLNPMSSTSGVGGAAGVEVSGGAGGSGGVGGESGTSPAGAGGEGGLGGMDTSGGTGGVAGTGGATAGTLTIDFTSVGNGGEYGPRNVGAVWIETSSGAFVKTVERWAGVRAVHLTRWNQASGGWPSPFFFATAPSPDEMDVVSTATLRPHQAHHATWNGKNLNGEVVPDGSYRVVIEVNESNFLPSISAEISFEKGASPQTLSPPDTGPYSGLSITYAP